MLLFYDFEVFKEDWLVVIYDMTAKQKHVIVNDADKLRSFYEAHVNDIWVGFNSRHYDQYILKAIILGMNPKEINDKIILKDMKGWQISNAFLKVPLYNYDCMPNPPKGLKSLECFAGASIIESDVDFNLDRKLTDAEIEETIKYCTHDVEQTIEVFMRTIDVFNAKMHLVKEFNLGLERIGDTEAKLVSLVLGCEKQDRTDEFDWKFLPCLDLGKYSFVKDWFEHEVPRDERCYDMSLKVDVAGVPHTFGFGGLHGASEKPIYEEGAIYHVDVNNYYPSLLIAWDLVTKSATNDNYAKVYQTRKALKMKQLEAKTKDEAKFYKKQQVPYKLALNALSGAMKDRFNKAYSPAENNSMCINGQLMLLSLIFKLESGIEGFKLIQSNTDGLIVKIPDTDEAFEQLDDICYEWEQRCSTDKCSITLSLDSIKSIYQKDVNNYLWINPDGSCGERVGAYVKELSPLDYDLPIVNKAMVNYLVNRTPIEKTIGDCDDLIEFQKLVKLSSKYGWVEHNNKKYTYKCYRVFASKDQNDGIIYKCGGARGKPEKFANTPEKCFILNDSVVGVKVPEKLDKSYYIEVAKKRLQQFGVEVR